MRPKNFHLEQVSGDVAGWGRTLRTCAPLHTRLLSGFSFQWPRPWSLRSSECPGGKHYYILRPPGSSPSREMAQLGSGDHIFTGCPVSTRAPGRSQKGQAKGVNEVSGCWHGAQAGPGACLPPFHLHPWPGGVARNRKSSSSRQDRSAMLGTGLSGE